jgi:hypothetical protein
MFITGVRLGRAVLAPGLAFALLELVSIHETLGAESEGWDVEELLEGDRVLARKMELAGACVKCLVMDPSGSSKPMVKLAKGADSHP